jgi:hypothetical protein
MGYVAFDRIEGMDALQGLLGSENEWEQREDGVGVL